jgi:hypothetical protein
MNRRPRFLAAVSVATIAAGFLAVAIAQAVTPPPGTPDLSQMTLQASDLAPGAKTTLSRYVAPGTDTIAEYDRSFAGVTTSAGVKLTVLSTNVLLANSATNAKGLYKDVRLVYASKLGRKLLAEAIVKSAGKLSGVTAKDVHFAKSASAGVGDQSLNQPIAIRSKHKAVAADFVLLRIGDVLASVTIVVRRGQLDRSVATGLAATIGAHITAVLASGATGSTGTTGATGSTGATGATG